MANEWLCALKIRWITFTLPKRYVKTQPMASHDACTRHTYRTHVHCNLHSSLLGTIQLLIFHTIPTFPFCHRYSVVRFWIWSEVYTEKSCNNFDRCSTWHHILSWQSSVLTVYKYWVYILISASTKSFKQKLIQTQHLKLFLLMFTVVSFN